MGECGCGETRPYKIVEIGGNVMVIEIYRGCEYCDTGLIVSLHLHTPESAAEFDFVPEEKSPSHEIKALKSSVIFIALMLAMFGSLNEQIKQLPQDMIWYDGYMRIFFGGNTESMTAVLNVLMFTYASILVGGKAASEVTKRAIDVLEELENKRREKLQEEQKKHILPVKNINDTISRIYSVYTSHAKIKDGDLIDISKHDFFDSVNDRWLKDGNGYSNSTTLIKNIEKVLSKRA